MNRDEMEYENGFEEDEVEEDYEYWGDYRERFTPYEPMCYGD